MYTMTCVLAKEAWQKNGDNGRFSRKCEVPANVGASQIGLNAPSLPHPLLAAKLTRLSFLRGRDYITDES